MYDTSPRPFISPLPIASPFHLLAILPMPRRHTTPCLTKLTREEVHAKTPHTDFSHYRISFSHYRKRVPSFHKHRFLCIYPLLPSSVWAYLLSLARVCSWHWPPLPGPRRRLALRVYVPLFPYSSISFPVRLSSIPDLVSFPDRYRRPLLPPHRYPPVPLCAPP